MNCGGRRARVAGGDLASRTCRLCRSREVSALRRILVATVGRRAALGSIADALAQAAENRHAQASPDLTTLEDEFQNELETLRWRRRESNPRGRTSRRRRPSSDG